VSRTSALPYLSEASVSLRSSSHCISTGSEDTLMLCHVSDFHVPPRDTNGYVALARVLLPMTMKTWSRKRFYPCNSLDLKYPLKAYLLKAWSPACDTIWEVVEPLRSRVWWEEFRSLGLCPWRGYWDLSPFLSLSVSLFVFLTYTLSLSLSVFFFNQVPCVIYHVLLP
jgi:hypothetical protein